MKNNDGKYLEYLVQLIEKSISPDSIIEHDVNLPILNSKIGATTQCDIVIRSGKKPRETLTIIEVQDRKYQVKPNDFRGWKQKLEEVGAQHLICVSRQEFPESIKEQASLSGNTIRLITLRELKAEQIPLDFFKHRFIYKHFQLTSIHKSAVTPPKAISKRKLIPKKFILNEKNFSLNKKTFTSLFLIFRDYVDSISKENSGRSHIKYKITKSPIYYFTNDFFIELGLDIEFSWSNTKTEVEYSTLVYEQNEFGVLAWVISYSYNSPTGIVSVKIPVTHNGENYQIRHMEVFSEMDTEFDLEFKVEKS